MRSKTYKGWTKREDEILLKNYKELSSKEIMNLLPDRTWNSVSSRCLQVLKIRKGCFKWRKWEDKIIKEKYSRANQKELMESLRGRTWIAIKSRARHLGLGYCRSSGIWANQWGDKEIEILREKYPTGGAQKVKLFLPNRTLNSIRYMAQKLKVSFIDENCNMSPLLSYTPEALYWIGFLFADAHFAKGNVYFTLAKKDDRSVKQLASFISCNNIKNINRKGGDGKYHDFSSLVFNSIKGVTRLSERFSIKSNKTYDPPNIELIAHNKKLMISMLIGLIDGDGHVYNPKNSRVAYVSVVAHYTWENFYKKIAHFLTSNFSNYRVAPKCSIRLRKSHNPSRSTLVVFYIRDHRLMKFLKKEAIRMNLPFMKRKWRKVDLKYVGEREQTPLVMATVKKMIGRGLNKKEIMKATKYSVSRVVWAMKKIIRQLEKDGVANV